jgi:hypothetical protein
MHRPEFALCRRYAHHKKSSSLSSGTPAQKEPRPNYLNASTSMQRDQQRKADTKNDEWNQEVNVGEDCADFFEIGHQESRRSAGDWRNHKDASRLVSTVPVGDCDLREAYSQLESIWKAEPHG